MDRHLTVTLKTDRIITVRLPDSINTVTSRHQAVSVVTLGSQGPVGSVAEEVLSKAAQASTDAVLALETSQKNQAFLDDVVTGMTNRFNYHARAISAQ